jgi:anthranilate synthase component 1
MQRSPSFEEFLALSRQGTLVPVWREFLFDTETTVTAYHKLRQLPFGFLLESVLGGEQWARYSFMGTRPRSAWKLSGSSVEWWTPQDGWKPLDVSDPMEDLDRRLAAERPVQVPGLPRFWGGAVGYFGYDMVRRIERLPEPPEDDLGLPEAMVMFTDVVVAIDNLKGTATAICPVPVEDGEDPGSLREKHAAALARLDALVETLARVPGPDPLRLLPEPDEDPPFRSSMAREDFEAAVERIREYIFAGDAFQVVLSQRLEMGLDGAPFDLYRALRSVNPSPYLYHLEMDGVTLVGSSPEVLVRLEDEVVTVRPIAGTRPRGATQEEDRALAEELLADEKELAEHRMLVDLGRNDVGRVASFGTVRVPDLMVVERYSHVMHLVSQVEGDVEGGRSALDVLQACFPAGTVSGAPKVRAMEIIDELEPVRRGPYAGAVGYVNYGGRSMDTAIAIRTVLVTGGKAYVQAGAGIVADSDPAREYEETLNKARALLRTGVRIGPAAG